MPHMFKSSVTVALCFTLTACGTPRGAGFQSEVLAASEARNIDADGEVTYDFAVFSVTRNTLPTVARWPDVDTKSYSWINRQEQPASLIIAPGDTLQLTIWDAEENSLLAGTGQRATPLQDIQVSSNGRVFVPYIGELRIAGMSPSTARERMEEEITKTIPSAQVQLLVNPGRANTANVVSGTTAPGVYPLADRNVKILDLLSQAGGVNPELANPQVRLIRGDQIYGVSLDRLLEEPNLDTPLQGGDRVIIRQDDRYFLSLGATGTEAQHTFPQADVSALDALSIIGGLSDERANPQGILILRSYETSDISADGAGPPQERVVFTLDLTSADGLFSAREFEIQPNDLVYATESALGPALSLVSALSSANSLFN